MNRQLLVAAALSLTVACLVLWRAYGPAPRPPTPHVRAAFVPERGNDKAIVVRGWSEAEVNKIVAGFCKAYDVPPEFYVVRGVESLRIKFPGDIQSDLLLFLVNYLNYPREVDLAGHEVHVMGSATLGADFDLPDEAMVGQRADLYVPPGDQAYDVVYVRLDSGTVWARSFGTSSWKRVN